MKDSIMSSGEVMEYLGLSRRKVTLLGDVGVLKIVDRVSTRGIRVFSRKSVEEYKRNPKPLPWQENRQQ